MSQLKNTKITKTHIIIAVVAVVTIAALIAVLSVVLVRDAENFPAIYSGRNFASDEVGTIAIPDEQQQKYVKDTAAKGDTRKFSFYTNTEISVSKQDSLVPIAFSNPSAGKHILLCSIVNEDGVVVYRSLGLAPGQYVSNVRFSQYLKYGTNELTMYVSAFETTKEDDEMFYDKVGTQKVKLKVVCGEDYGS